ncbi:MAG: hypothetical protein NBKEAIPA_03558 [Nitrospirae bacterium]|nr:MAG: hypothetical protein UZ03_NOB001001658 [Nitrospira sp. OLB3]MBV6471624.1 hypothetical protein [Nitrospirota bacterium]MCE7966674.1 hypothetical protein [Nitrospira sp. NTP2]MCK6493865.1 hypothetical protein [Nitrospira sp.]MEB2338692.1 hypothetical protein [Nitrospirales bacterium]
MDVTGCVQRLATAGLCLVLASLQTPAPAVAADTLSDLTGKVSPVVTLRSRDNFSSEYRYDVTVRNNSADLFVADSLIVVLDRITNIAGEDHENLTNESLLSRMEILGQDGTTDDGKPFFRIPSGSGPDLVPHSESLPASVRIRNRDYVAVFTPSFRVMGVKREPPKPKNAAGSAAAAQPPGSATLDKLIQLLIKKGTITPEEGRALQRP